MVAPSEGAEHIKDEVARAVSLLKILTQNDPPEHPYGTVNPKALFKSKVYAVPLTTSAVVSSVPAGPVFGTIPPQRRIDLLISCRILYEPRHFVFDSFDARLV